MLIIFIHPRSIHRTLRTKQRKGENVVVVVVVVLWLSLLRNFIQISLNSGSAQVQTLLAACQTFAMVSISDNGPGWKYGYSPFVSQPYHKNSSSKKSLKLKVKINNSHHSYAKSVKLFHLLRNKGRKVAEIFWRVRQIS